MALTTFVFVPAMIAGGFLLGPRGIEGVILAPAVLFASWASILYWHFGRKTKTKAMLTASPVELPAQADDWLDQQRRQLPPSARNRCDTLSQLLASLTPQLGALPRDAPTAHALRRLLGEELPDLVNSYTRVPVAFRHKVLHGAKTPEQQLLEGLDTITLQIDQMHAQLAVDDLHALATQERYLELKYKRKGELE